jgi:hypothetical protein
MKPVATRSGETPASLAKLSYNLSSAMSADIAETTPDVCF